MDGQNGKKVYTDQYVMCGQGKKEKEYAFQACSDSNFTETELAEFKNALATDNLRLPLRKQTEAKLDDIHALFEHQWTEADIQAKIDKSNAMRTKYLTFGRDRIIRRRDEAASRGDDAVVARCNSELATYDAGGGTKAESKPGAPNKHAQQERLAQLNRQNRKLNSEEVRKAQLAQKRQEQKARDEAIAKAAKKAEEAKAKAAASLQVPDDLFGDVSDASRQGTPGLGGSAAPKVSSRAGTPMNGVGGAAEKKKKFGQFRKKNMDDDVIAGMDLGIEIDI